MSNDIREALYNILLGAMEDSAGDTDRIGMADRAMKVASEILARFDLTPGGGEEDPLVCPRCGSSPEVVTYTYDGFGNLFRTDTITPTNRPLGQVSSSVYDGNGRSLWKEAGNRSDPAPDEVEEDAADPADDGEAPQGTTVTYDEFGNLIIRVEPDDAGGATDEEATDEGDDEE